MQKYGHMVFGLALAVLAVMGAADLALATDPTPSYTVDLSQVTVDIKAVVVSLIALALVVFGGKKVLALFGR